MDGYRHTTAIDSHRRPDWVTWESVGHRGRAVWRRQASGNHVLRLDFGRLGDPPKRVFIDSLPSFDGGRRRLRCADHSPEQTDGRLPHLSEPCPACELVGERELSRVHAMLVAGDSLETVLSRIRNRPAPERLVENAVGRYLKHFRALVDQEQRSPTSLREIVRWAAPGGHFSWWFGADIETITNGQVEDWHAWLGLRINEKTNKPISAKTRKNVSDGFRRFLRWLHFREEIARVPTFPTISVPEYLPKTLALDTRAKVLAEIPWPKRGAFLACAWLLMRPREVRACDLDDYDRERGALAVFKAFQGPRLDAPIRHTKSRVSGWREVWEDELRDWIKWRLEQATPETRIRGEVALFWCPTARNHEKRWADDPMRQEWNRACVQVGVSIPLYQGTKHSTASALAEGGIQPLVLKALGGWRDSKSVERYAKPRATRDAIVRHLPSKP